MTPFLFSLVVMYLAWWMFAAEFRRFLYSEWTVKPFSTWEHLKGAVPFVLRQLSPQNIQAQGFVDGEIKLLNQRRSFMLFSFQRLAVIFPGIVLLATLQIEVFISLIVVATVLLALFFKKPGRSIQIAFLAGVFFMTFQWSFYQANQWVFAPETHSFIYFLADGKLFNFFVFMAVGIFLTILTRYEFWSLWLSAILLFAGGMAYLNVFGLILGESLGWALYWFAFSRFSSKKNKTVTTELLLLTIVSSLIFVVLLFWFKRMGLLDIRVISPFVGKKVSLLIGWGLWEILLTCVLLAWGHFRSQALVGETTDLESIKIPLPAVGQGLLKYRGWLPDQLQFRRAELERRLNSLRKTEAQMNESRPASVPVHLQKKMHAEVESLKHLLGALSKYSV